MNIRLENKIDSTEEFIKEFCKDIDSSDKRKSKGVRYSSVICSFDIETSDVEINGDVGNVVYLWSFSWVDLKKCIGINQEEIIRNAKCISGRSIKQYDGIIRDVFKVISHYECSILVFVHNLDYEMDRVLIQSEIHKELYNPEKSLFIGSHQPLFVIVGYSNFIEYRDTLKLFNYSLSQAAEQYGFKKLDYEYKRNRYSESELEEKDWEYNVNDAKITLGCVIKMCEFEEYRNVFDIPLTSTSRTRYANRNDKSINKVHGRYVKKGSTKEIKEETSYDIHKKIAMKERITDEYSVDKNEECFTGGYTHANRHFAFNVINDVLSCDFVSDYPGIMTSCYFPYKVKEYKNEDKKKVLERCHRLNLFKLGNSLVKGVLENHMCPVKAWFCATVVFSEIEAKVFKTSNGMQWEMPVVSVSKTNNSSFEQSKWTVDNGRIIKANNVEITINAIDLINISIMYDYEISEVLWLEISERMDSLDDFKLNCINKWYKDKCGWKKIKNKFKDTGEIDFTDFVNEYHNLCSESFAMDMVNLSKSDKEEFIFRVGVEYTKSKNRLNGQYGIMVMAVNRETTVCDLGEDYSFNKGEDKSTHQTEIYRHGVCVTSYARLFLSVFTYLVCEMSDAVPVYWDTDSVKLCVEFCDRKLIREAVNLYNSYVKKVRSDIPSEIGYMDDNDGYYEKFITLGCKRYMVLEDGKIHTTVAGLPKKQAEKYYNELYKKLGNFETLVEYCFKPNTFISEEATDKIIPLYFSDKRPMLKGFAVDSNGKKCYIEEYSGYRLVNVGFALCDLTKVDNMVYYNMCKSCNNELDYEIPENTIISVDKDGYSVKFGKCFVPDCTKYKVQ